MLWAHIVDYSTYVVDYLICVVDIYCGLLDVCCGLLDICCGFMLWVTWHVTHNICNKLSTTYQRYPQHVTHKVYGYVVDYPAHVVDY
jgi:hypothetical protein